MLTQTQASDEYIMSSMAQYLDRAVRVAYNAAADASVTNNPTQPALRYAQHLMIREAKPTDISVTLNQALVAMQFVGGGEKRDFIELGLSSIWRTRSFMLCCYPGLDANGQPCDVAKHKLRSLMTSAFETEDIKIMDMSNGAFSPTNIIYCGDPMYITRASEPIERNLNTMLAVEKHRFDLNVGVRFPVTASLAN
jgi:hypothetical protein